MTVRHNSARWDPNNLYNSRQNSHYEGSPKPYRKKQNSHYEGSYGSGERYHQQGSYRPIQRGEAPGGRNRERYDYLQVGRYNSDQSDSNRGGRYARNDSPSSGERSYDSPSERFEYGNRYRQRY